MSTAKSPSRTSTWIAVLLGLVILGALVAFSVALPKATGSSSGELKLPDTLPGGYVATDLPKAFAGGQAADRADQIAAQEAHARKYGDAVLSDVLPNAAVTRTYVTKDLQAVYVQAFRSEGGAFAPNSMSDPKTTGEKHAPLELSRVGDAVCIQSWGSQAATGQPQPANPQYVQCQRSEDALTVQVSSASVSAQDLADLADSVLSDLQ